MKKPILIIGGTGFVGSALTKDLIQAGYTVKSIGREVDITKISSLKPYFHKQSIVINLVGLSPLRKPSHTTYKAVHVDGVRNIVKLCKQYSARLIHISALGVSPHAQTQYLKTKYEAEKIIQKEGTLQSTIVRPSVLYDTTHELFTLCTKLLFLRSFPNIPAKVQPVHRLDLVRLLKEFVKRKPTQQLYELGGPKEYTLYEMVRLYFHAKKRLCIPIPLLFAKLGLLGAILLQKATMDQIKNLTLDSITLQKIQQNQIVYEDWLKSLS